ncbi:unnamed protein product [Arabidopsis halleri]
MGLPEDFINELQIQEFVVKILYVIGFIRDMVDALCPYIGLPSFLDHHETAGSDPTTPHALSTSASLANELILVVRFSDLLTDPEDCCTLCLSDFDSNDKIRACAMRLPKCGHVFHQSCLDRWIVDLTR